MLACDPPHRGAGGVDISTFILPQTPPPPSSSVAPMPPPIPTWQNQKRPHRKHQPLAKDYTHTHTRFINHRAG